jgi:hypothetical protein
LRQLSSCVRSEAPTRVAQNDVMESIDVVVIGAGPAGLSAGCALVDAGISTLVVDSGKLVRDRDRFHPTGIASGVGGAGLYSDGKFSFRPSASRLWVIEPEPDREQAYNWFIDLLRDQPWFLDIDQPELKEIRTSSRGVIDKRYPSFYMSLPERTALIERLAERIPAIAAETELHELVDQRSHILVVLTGPSGERRIETTGVIVATGRYGPVRLRSLGRQGPWSQGRVEIGVRLEQPSTRFLLRSHPATDPKIVVRTSAGWEARTFCCCRDGEVLAVATGDWVTVCGRADGPPTGRSNVGVVLRPPLDARSESELLLDRATGAGRWLKEPAEELLGHQRGELADILGGRAVSSLVEAIREIALAVDAPPPMDSLLHGLAVEGVGWYPDLQPDLRWGDWAVWVAGDATGLFRGLTAAFVSGYFTGLRAAEVCRRG